MLIRVYYTLKPYIPWTIRMALRRLTARRKRAKSKRVWPINEAAGWRPAGWPGWPGNKKFALVLTHDVENPFGLSKCRQLAELELELGYRSSFNFIPEGPYAVSPELREWLTEGGFEVGVHDLHHDGHLFGAYLDFKSKAVRINHYLKEWNAVGFRSGFMLRNLDWVHKLDISYDASTFDTDPFEIQPKGADTIFPFWIPTPPPSVVTSSPFLQRSGGGPAIPRAGYFELPYTLPQDSTLFLVLGESSPEIWQRKLDWIVARGGMALVNVHPDYINFSAGPGSKKEYPASMYADLLRYATEKYGGQFWNPRARDVAHWLDEINYRPAFGPVALNPTTHSVSSIAGGLRGKRAAVLLYSNFPFDPRPRRAAEAMVEAGMEVDLFCLSEAEGDSPREIVGGIQVFRLPMQHSRGSKWTYLRQYGRFLNSSFWFLTRRSFRGKYDVVHVHNMPDMLVFSALLPKIRGAKVILDLHDPMPELMMTIYGLDEKHRVIKILKRIEKWCIRFADVAITVNAACKKIFSARSCRSEKVHVIMNSPDESIFKYREVGEKFSAASSGQFIIMYHGSIVERHGLDLAVGALKRIRRNIPGAELRIYGRETPFLRSVLASVPDDLRTAVRYLGPKNLEQIVEAIKECDVGVIPNRRSLFTEINTPTRIFEYLSQSKPVIAPLAPGILDYFGPAELVYFQLGDEEDLAKQMEYVFSQPQAIGEIVKRGQGVYRQHAWSTEKHQFVRLVADLLGVNKSMPGDAPTGEKATLELRQ